MRIARLLDVRCACYAVRPGDRGLSYKTILRSRAPTGLRSVISLARSNADELNPDRESARRTARMRAIDGGTGWSARSALRALGRFMALVYDHAVARLRR